MSVNYAGEPVWWNTVDPNDKRSPEDRLLRRFHAENGWMTSPIGPGRSLGSEADTTPEASGTPQREHEDPHTAAMRRLGLWW